VLKKQSEDETVREDHAMPVLMLIGVVIGVVVMLGTAYFSMNAA